MSIRVQISADARKQQLQQQEQPEQPGIAVASAATRSATVLADQEQRKALKFGFSSKGGTSKVSLSFHVCAHLKKKSPLGFEDPMVRMLLNPKTLSYFGLMEFPNKKHHWIYSLEM